MKPGIPKGTRDFKPQTVRKRQYILNTLKNVFEKFGFQPIETPTFENIETLMGKYGEEGDRLIFKILNNGLNNPQKEDKLRQSFEEVLSGKTNANLTERALRYDLTIPFARFVVMHQNDLVFPFRRYQMQPVWRADRPQKGRYREFWQCDADIIGSNSLINEAELISLYCQAFATLKIPKVIIRINNRKILAGMAECCGAATYLTDITVAIDKLDKIGKDGVAKALADIGLSNEQVNFIIEYLNRSGNTINEISRITKLLADNKTAQKGLEELKEILNILEQLGGISSEIKVEFDGSLARGLNYYTGFITEVFTEATQMSSIGGGGRYDDLTGLFGLKGISGVGVSFGVDRIYDVMETLDLFPTAIVQNTTKIVFLNLESATESILLNLVGQLRDCGISAEIYPDVKKLDKQMKYANKRGIPYVGILGDAELQNGTIQLKNMLTGEQRAIAVSEFTTIFREAINDND